MKKSKISEIFEKIADLFNVVWNTFNQVPKDGKFPKAKETPYKRNHPWDQKRRHRPKNASKDDIHNEWPLGSERTETKTFNKLRKQRQ